MNADEWQRTIRNDPSYRWNQTQNAKSMAADLAAQMAQTMGSA
jgi:hypothetical protein